MYLGQFGQQLYDYCSDLFVYLGLCGKHISNNFELFRTGKDEELLQEITVDNCLLVRVH